VPSPEPTVRYRARIITNVNTPLQPANPLVQTAAWSQGFSGVVIFGNGTSIADVTASKRVPGTGQGAHQHIDHSEVTAFQSQMEELNTLLSSRRRGITRGKCRIFFVHCRPRLKIPAKPGWRATIPVGIRKAWLPVSYCGHEAALHPDPSLLVSRWYAGRSRSAVLATSDCRL